MMWKTKERIMKEKKDNVRLLQQSVRAMKMLGGRVLGCC